METNRIGVYSLVGLNNEGVFVEHAIEIVEMAMIRCGVPAANMQWNLVGTSSPMEVLFTVAPLTGDGVLALREKVQWIVDNELGDNTEKIQTSHRKHYLLGHEDFEGACCSCHWWKADVIGGGGRRICGHPDAFKHEPSNVKRVITSGTTKCPIEGGWVQAKTARWAGCFLDNAYEPGNPICERCLDPCVPRKTGKPLNLSLVPAKQGCGLWGGVGERCGNCGKWSPDTLRSAEGLCDHAGSSEHAEADDQGFLVTVMSSKCLFEGGWEPDDDLMGRDRAELYNMAGRDLGMTAHEAHTWSVGKIKSWIRGRRVGDETVTTAKKKKKRTLVCCPACDQQVKISATVEYSEMPLATDGFRLEDAAAYAIECYSADMCDCGETLEVEYNEHEFVVTVVSEEVAETPQPTEQADPKVDVTVSEFLEQDDGSWDEMRRERFSETLRAPAEVECRAAAIRTALTAGRVSCNPDLGCRDCGYDLESITVGNLVAYACTNPDCKSLKVLLSSGRIQLLQMSAGEKKDLLWGVLGVAHEVEVVK